MKKTKSQVAKPPKTFFYRWVITSLRKNESVLQPKKSQENENEGITILSEAKTVTGVQFFWGQISSQFICNSSALPLF